MLRFTAAFLPLLCLTAAAIAAEGTPVQVALTREEPIQRIVQLTGTVTSARAASLSPATAGLVTALRVDAGSEVVAGELLLELDPEPARLQWQSAQAAATAARVALEDARRRLEEARTLAPQRSIAETVVRDLVAEVAEDDAALQQATAEAEYRKAILDRHSLRAPFDGVVSEKLTELGEWVVPGSPVLELVATGDLRIDFPVAEDYLQAVDRETRITYSLGNDGEARAGKVATAVPVSDPGARTFLLRVVPAAPDPRLAPGISAQGRLMLAAGRSALVVPRDAIIRYPDGRVIVWVVAEDGVVTEKIVTTGLEFDGLVEIRSGLAPRTRVVVEGNEALQIGQSVRIVERAAG